MQGQARHKLFGEKAETKVLHNQGIDLGHPALHQQLGDLLELFGENQNIEGEKPLDATRMQPAHDFGEITTVEIFSSQSGIEHLNPEIHRVSSSSDGSLEGIPISSRCKEFR